MKGTCTKLYLRYVSAPRDSIQEIDPWYVHGPCRLWEGLKPQCSKMPLKPKFLCLAVTLVFYESSHAMINSSPNRSLQLLSGRVDPYCNRSCHSDVDCNQAGGCMQCDYYRNKSGTFKLCQTLSETCGGPPSPPNSSLSQYLAIGDSITYGQFPYIKADLEGICEAHLVTRNAGPTGEVLSARKFGLGKI